MNGPFSFPIMDDGLNLGVLKPLSEKGKKVFFNFF
jgi:hypothetical protein